MGKRKTRKRGPAKSITADADNAGSKNRSAVPKPIWRTRSARRESEDYIDPFHITHSTWIQENPQGTLSELRGVIRRALAQCNKLEGRIETKRKIPEPLMSQLAEWGEPYHNLTFAMRSADLEDILDHLNQLVLLHGEDFLAAQVQDSPPRYLFDDELH